MRRHNRHRVGAHEHSAYGAAPHTHTIVCIALHAKHSTLMSRPFPSLTVAARSVVPAVAVLASRSSVLVFPRSPPFSARPVYRTPNLGETQGRRGSGSRVGAADERSELALDAEEGPARGASVRNDERRRQPAPRLVFGFRSADRYVPDAERRAPSHTSLHHIAFAMPHPLCSVARLRCHSFTAQHALLREAPDPPA